MSKLLLDLFTCSILDVLFITPFKSLFLLVPLVGYKVVIVSFPNQIHLFFKKTKTKQKTKQKQQKQTNKHKLNCTKDIIIILCDKPEEKRYGTTATWLLSNGP